MITARKSRAAGTQPCCDKSGRTSAAIVFQYLEHFRGFESVVTDHVGLGIPGISSLPGPRLACACLTPMPSERKKPVSTGWDDTSIFTTSAARAGFWGAHVNPFQSRPHLHCRGWPDACRHRKKRPPTVSREYSTGPRRLAQVPAGPGHATTRANPPAADRTRAPVAARPRTAPPAPRSTAPCIPARGTTCPRRA